MNRYICVLGFIAVFGVMSCGEFVDVEDSNSLVRNDVVFSDDNSAVSAINGVYHQVAASRISSGLASMARLSGLSADELRTYLVQDGVSDFEMNSIRADNENIRELWNSLYRTIYYTNSMLDGLSKSTSLSSGVKQQLMGECRFVRAFCYFYLVNLFGEVPVTTEIDYERNSTLRRESADVVYDLIEQDLLSAESSMAEEYPGADRIRPNSYAASALLARVYLHLRDWENAELKATRVLNNVGSYELVSDLGSVFSVFSREAIWQIAPIGLFNYTDEARYFVVNGTPEYLVLRDELVQAVEPGDDRLSAWMSYIVLENDTVYYPFKYQLLPADAPVAQYSAVMRLSEQYLVRAEARTKLNKIGEAIMDLDSIRRRAGLPLLADADSSIDQSGMLTLIEHERRIELFSEWGIRWLDLKRWNKVVSVLKPFKTDVVEDDALYPIPQVERQRNPFLGDQNNGY